MKKIVFITLVSVIVFTGCSNKKPGKTIENLKAATKGETTASVKYAAFAQKAKEDGFNNLAKLFEAASKSESIHAANHKKVLDELGEKMEDFKPSFEVNSTAENLKAAIDGETYEVNTMYPQFLLDAKDENINNAVKSFTWAFDTEKKHQQFYTKAMEALNSEAESTLPMDYLVCPVCGNTYDKANVDEKCAFCQTSKEKFIII